MLLLYHTRLFFPCCRSSLHALVCSVRVVNRTPSHSCCESNYYFPLHGRVIVAITVKGTVFHITNQPTTRASVRLSIRLSITRRVLPEGATTIIITTSERPGRLFPVVCISSSRTIITIIIFVVTLGSEVPGLRRGDSQGRDTRADKHKTATEWTLE